VSVKSSGKRERVLDPIERESEVLFGLIMVLSFTGSMSVASSDQEEVRSVLIGAIGCNLAWGLVDAVMYLLTILIERGRSLSIGRAIRASPDAENGRRLLAEALPEPMDKLFEGSALESARQRLVAVPQLRARPSLGKRDWLGALGVFLLVFLSTFPVVLPFLFASPLHTAMRISNAVAIAMLYVMGHRLGRHAGLGSVRTGLVMVALGMVLVGITIALGG
jgi:VIT1/CCC1 family predicted Fe2+/Mn2+ transporter